ncbi:MAG TPA: DUF721 domain-containing protein [candidate division Zixibacteria bacterium]|nr:DUF721 domain-containing protein [candidate division Zixibacteria bacterium]
MSHNDRPTKLAEQITKVIDNLGHRRSFLGWNVVERWPQIAGERIAKISQAERFADGALYVRVERDNWRQSLEREEQLLLRAIRDTVGAGVVERIHFR